jgi:hypothetical protein
MCTPSIGVLDPCYGGWSHTGTAAVSLKQNAAGDAMVDSLQGNDAQLATAGFHASTGFSPITIIDRGEEGYGWARPEEWTTNLAKNPAEDHNRSWHAELRKLVDRLR